MNKRGSGIKIPGLFFPKGKKGFELSINLIVTLILAIVILSFGIYFVKMIYEKSTEMKLTLDQQTEIELERLMDSGEKVSIYPGRRTVGSGEMATFGLGVLNIQDIKNFKIKIKFDESIGLRAIPKILTAEKSGENSLTISKTIEKNNKEKTLIGIKISNAGKGTHVFNVDVYYDKDGNDDGYININDPNNIYDSTHKIYVNIK